MGRLRSKKFSAHSKAAKSTAASAKPSQPAASGASARASAVAEAAVKAAFEDDEDDGEENPVDNEASDAEGDDELSGLSRGQRKRMKRRGAFLRKMGLVQRVVAEKESAKKKQEQGAFAEIQELQDALFLSDKELAARAASKISQSTNVTAKSTAAASLKPKKLSGKQRQKLAVRELGQLKAVHTHPQFQTDPFAAIQLHLQNTVVQANAATLQKQQAPAKSKNAMDTE
jgi:hypothetical protein